MGGTYDKAGFRRANEFMVDAFVSTPQWIPISLIAEGDQVAVLARSVGDTVAGFAAAGAE